MSSTKKSPKESKNQNHYETLGLKQNCSEQQVKDAFITLSKTHHPDKNPSDPSQNDKFVKIYEAYQVLSRPEKRSAYDFDLRYQYDRLSREYEDGLRVKTNAPQYAAWRDESIWGMRDKNPDDFNKDKPYYGIKGVKRVSNYWIAGGAVAVMMLGAVFHFTALKHSAAFTVTQLNTRDEKNAHELFKARRTAKRNGNEQQIELFSGRFGWAGEDVTSKKD